MAGGTSSATSTLAKGAAILGAAAIVSKLLGVLQKVPLQNIGGDEAFGIYSIVFPFYTLILFLATAGFPVAVSKFVSEAIQQGQDEETGHILLSAFVVLTGTGLLFFAVLFFGAPGIAYLIGNDQTVRSIQSVSLALFFVPVMAALRGYYQGKQNMVPTAASQVWEQFVRVGTMLALLWWFHQADFGHDWVAAGATFGSATGALAGLLVMIYYHRKYVRQRRKQQVEEHVSASLGHVSSRPRISKYWIRKLTQYALPICLGAIVVPILNIADTFTMPRLIAAQGYTAAAAMKEYGIYARGLPLVQMVAMLFSSMSVALVPAIAASRAKGSVRGVQLQARTALRLTWLVGLASSVGLCLLATPINGMFYTNTMGSDTIRILAFTIMFSVTNIMTASVLQGMDAVRIPALHLMIAALMKVALNLLLVPVYGIQGAAIAAVVSFGTAAALNIRSLIRMQTITLKWKMDMGIPLIAVAAMALVLQGWQWLLQLLPLLEMGWPARATATLTSLTGVLIGAVVFVIVLITMKGLEPEEIRHIPGLRFRQSRGKVKP
ncbi:putative polysaccharide biosynthesis protein [Marinicrinis sediminis]|uniref:Oligosaccharide flippase family protein n=1 Tax=Marinicrinis sediminis TaxID=1652465 RepID=A0ABW5R919_9BACL